MFSNEDIQGSNLYWHTMCFQCKACWPSCEICNSFKLDVQCSLILDIVIHLGHEHKHIISSVQSEHNCCCDNNIYPIFCCTTCEFSLDFKCATLPRTTRYTQHEHPFTFCYTAEDNSGEYYCDICKEERDPKHMIYDGSTICILYNCS